MHTNEFDEIIEYAVGQSKYGPDKSQQKVIKSINNTVVSAGAGSGKTEVLATRFAYLLMTDPELHVSNILAITFTKKAASEIYARVFKKLNDFKNSLSDKEKYGDRYLGQGKPVALAERALKEFSDARIQTLDSYSQEIVKMAVARYGIKPDFSVVDGGSDLNARALNFVIKCLQNPDYEEVFQTYSKIGKLEPFAKTYFVDPVLNYTSIVTKKGWFSENFRLQKRIVFEDWNSLVYVSSDPDEEKITMEYLFRQIKNNYNLKKDEKHSKGLDYSETPFFKAIYNGIKAGEKVDFENLSLDADELDSKKILEKVLPLKNFIMKMKEVRGNASGYVKTITEYSSQFKSKNDLDLVNKVISIIAWIENISASEKLCFLLDEFLEEVNQDKKRKGLLSFKDIGELALCVFEEQKDILKQQQNQIKKIMIDEFQDNNEKNKKLLEYLAGDSREKLFFVGDEKQSIYKFRGADVSVFNGLKKELKGVNENDQVLFDMNNNYRSDKELLKAFNELFGYDSNPPEGIHKKEPVQVMESGNILDLPSLFYLPKGNVPDFEAQYLKVTSDGKSNYVTNDSSGEDSVEPVDLTKKENIRIHACVLNSGKNPTFEKDGIQFSDFKNENKILNEDETIAFFIAKKIKEMGKPYSRFAVLDCSRTHRKELTKFFAMADIPYNIDVQKNIFSEGIVNDFYNFLRICVYPSDSNAFSSFLTSPFCGMSVFGARNVMALINQKSQKFIDEDGNEVIKNFCAFSEDFNVSDFDISQNDQEKYNRGKELFQKKKMEILSSSITKTIEKLWYETGYFYETKLNSNTQICGEQFDLLYEIAVQAENGGRNIQWFVDQLAITKKLENSFLKDETSDMETEDVKYPLEKEDAVTIMTIHQSKGLEFDTVFVTGIFGDPKKDKNTNMYYDEKTGVSFSPLGGNKNIFFLKNQNISNQKILAEQKRLIYVAITRAKHEVFLVGDVSLTDKLRQKKKSKEFEKDAEASLMHGILRYYFDESHPENHIVDSEGNVTNAKDQILDPTTQNIYGLYGTNNFDDQSLEGEKYFLGPFFNDGVVEGKRKITPMDFYQILPVSAKARTNPSFLDKNQESVLNYEDLVNRKKEELEEVFKGESQVFEFQGLLQKTSSPSGLEKVEHETPDGKSELMKVVSEILVKKQNPDYEVLDQFFAEKEIDFPEDSEYQESAKKIDFNKGVFGTMVHSYMEHWVNNGNLQGVENSPLFDANVLKSLSDNFDQEQHKKISDICVQMAKAFASSKLGVLVLKAKEFGRVCKAENNFKMMLGDVLFTGSVDLFFENEDHTFTLVDYKTDGNINPEKYFEQQACYRFALEKIYGVKISECWLYFTRFEKEIEITSQVLGMSEEQVLKKLEKMDKSENI